MLVVDFCVAFAVIIYKESFAHLFTTNNTVIQLLKPTFDTMAILLVVGGSTIVLSGALRGLGMQTIAAWIVLFSQYICSIPAGYIFAITMDFGIRGIW
jgi:MATE family multidrug resistance protein